MKLSSSNPWGFWDNTGLLTSRKTQHENLGWKAPFFFCFSSERGKKSIIQLHLVISAIWNSDWLDNHHGAAESLAGRRLNLINSAHSWINLLIYFTGLCAFHPLGALHVRVLFWFPCFLDVSSVPRLVPALPQPGVLGSGRFRAQKGLGSNPDTVTSCVHTFLLLISKIAIIVSSSESQESVGSHEKL